MDSPVVSRLAETEAHVRLKRLALLWAQTNRYTACAAEVSLPQCRYRADVAAYRSRMREQTVTAIFEVNRRCLICAEIIVRARRRGNVSSPSRAVVRRSKNIFASITPLFGRAIRSSLNTIRTTSMQLGTAATGASFGKPRRSRTVFTAARNSNAWSAIAARICFSWSCLTNCFAPPRRPPDGEYSST